MTLRCRRSQLAGRIPYRGHLTILTSFRPVTLGVWPSPSLPIQRKRRSATGMRCPNRLRWAWLQPGQIPMRGDRLQLAAFEGITTQPADIVSFAPADVPNGTVRNASEKEIPREDSGHARTSDTNVRPQADNYWSSSMGAAISDESAMTATTVSFMTTIAISHTSRLIIYAHTTLVEHSDSVVGDGEPGKGAPTSPRCHEMALGGERSSRRLPCA